MVRRKQRKQSKVEIIYPGDWIEYVTHKGGGDFRSQLAFVEEVTAQGDLVVCYGSYFNEKETISPRRVLKKYPQFGVWPIPGKARYP